MIDKENKDNPYSDWFQKIKEASDKNAKNAPEKDDLGNDNQESTESKKNNLILAFLVFLAALIVRLYFTFFITNPENGAYGWYNDIYHHWQIGYLTKEVGFSHGFLRLWDFKGMEYFWGPFHPWTLAFLFTVTGLKGIIVPKLLSIIAGSGAIAVLFLIGRKFFNLRVALAVAVLTIFNPIGIFTDTSGMQEPLGILLLFLAIYFWPSSPFLTGLFFGLASMTRAEYWLFSLGLIISIFIVSRERIEKKIVCVAPYVIVILLYIKYLINYTNNPFYPIYWNFMGNAAGQWQPDISPNAGQIFARYLLGIILLISSVGIIFTFKKRPKWFLLALLGLGNFAFLAYFIGFTDYLLSYLPRFWLDRIFWLPYILASLMLAAFFFGRVNKNKIFQYLNHGLWLVLILIVFLMQIIWIPIWHYYAPQRWSFVLERKQDAAKEALSYYKGGSILIPEDDQVFTYYLIKNSKIPGKNLIGQMFDPFYYMPEDPFSKWGKNKKIIFDWLKKENIKLMLIKPESSRYRKMIEIENHRFKFLKQITNGANLEVYEVKN